MISLNVDHELFEVYFNYHGLWVIDQSSRGGKDARRGSSCILAIIDGVLTLYI